LNLNFEKFMRVKANPIFSIVDVIKLWPWFAVLSFLVLIVWILRLGSGTPSEPAPVIIASPQPSTVMPIPSQATPIEQTAEATVPDGEVDPVPVVSHLPVAHGEVRNQDRVHAGDDSMFLKDEGVKTEEE
jgi:hypothetical protein